MGSGASVQNKRYMGGKTYPKFFKDDVWSLNEDLLDYLGLTEGKAFQVFAAFAQCDVNENGVVDSIESFKYFNLQRTLFTERLFFFEREEPDGSIRRAMNLLEFIISLWSFCSLSSEGIARYVFEIFDIDNNYLLEKRHVRTMFKMLYGTDTVEEEYLKPFPFDSNKISKAEFIACTGGARRSKGNILLKPALSYQQTLRKRSGGVNMWTAITAHRLKHLAVYDRQYDHLHESVAAIVEAGVTLGNDRRALKDPQHLLQQQSLKIQNETSLMQRELQQRQLLAAQEQRKAEIAGPDRLMKRGWAAFETAKQSFLDEEFTTDDALKRQQRRLHLFTVLEQAIEIAQDYYEQADIKDRTAVIGTEVDNEARYIDYLEDTESGEGAYLKQLIELKEVFSILMKQITEKNSKNRFRKAQQKSEKQVLVETNLAECNRLLDQIYGSNNNSDSSITKEERAKRMTALMRRELTDEEAIAKQLATKKDFLAAEVAAKEFLSKDLHQRTLADFEIELAARQEERRRDFIRKDWDLTTSFGSRITEWEWLLDKQTNRSLYVSNKTGQRRHPKTAICEKCDAIMVQHELRCLGCDAARSAKNLKLYRPLGFKDITLE